MRRDLEALRTKNYSERTLETRENYLVAFIRWCEERSITRPTEVTKPMLERCQRYLFHLRRENGRPLTFSDAAHFGLGLSASHVRSASRRDRLLLLVAVAHTLLTILGASAEETGLDKYLKVNTVKRRTHSLFRQGQYWLRRIATMRDEWFRPLVLAFDRLARE